MAAERRTYDTREERDEKHWKLVDLGFKPNRFSYADPECLKDDDAPLKIVWGLSWGEEGEL